MPDLGSYAGTVLAAYAVGLALLAGLVLMTLLRARRVKRALAEAEANRTPRPVFPSGRDAHAS